MSSSPYTDAIRFLLAFQKDPTSVQPLLENLDIPLTFRTSLDAEAEEASLYLLNFLDKKEEKKYALKASCSTSQMKVLNEFLPLCNNDDITWGMMHATSLGQLEPIKALSQKASPETLEAGLMVSCQQNFIKCVEFFSHLVDVDSLKPSDMHPLIQATERNYLSIVEFLLPLIKSDKKRKTLIRQGLVKACRKNHTDVALFFINLSSPHINQNDALIAAIKNNNRDLMEKLAPKSNVEYCVGEARAKFGRRLDYGLEKELSVWCTNHHTKNILNLSLKKEKHEKEKLSPSPKKRM